MGSIKLFSAGDKRNGVLVDSIVQAVLLRNRWATKVPDENWARGT